METLTKADMIKGKTKIYVPYKNKTITFIYPPIGPSTYEDLMNQINSENLLMPTSAQVISLLDLILQNKNEPTFIDILSKFKNEHLPLFTSTISDYLLEGTFVYDDIDGKVDFSVEELYKKLEVKDKGVRFIPHHIKEGQHSIEGFVRNPYVTAQFWEESISKVERVIKNLKLRRGFVSTSEKRPEFEYRLEDLAKALGKKISHRSREHTIINYDINNLFGSWFAIHSFYLDGGISKYYHKRGFVFGLCNVSESDRTQKVLV